MRQYKLIKKYPASPKLGFIVFERHCGMYHNMETGNMYGSQMIENQPEYWEEVIKKDYEILISRVVPQEILSVKRLSDGEVFSVGDSVEGGTILEIRIDKFYTGGVAFSLDTSRVESLISIEKAVEKDYEILSYLKKGSTTCITTKRRGGENHEEYWNIHKVKRLSDGEIFTVGDIISCKNGSSNKRLDKIKLVNDDSSFVNGIWFHYSSGCSHFKHAIKQKQPIFLTHDGKDIFAGDKVWYINKATLYSSFLIPVLGTKFFSDINAYFLTQEAASDYIKRNKVLFTTEDGVDIKKGDTYFFVDTDFSINLSNAHPGCGQYSERKYFSTFETAQYYVIVNAKVLSIEEFWEFVSKPGSNVVKQKALKRLVKERLKIE
jgi:hypothetical protein